MTRPLIPLIFAMAATVVASNILVQFVLGDWLTWGAFSYPLAFFVNDITNRLYGARAARKVVIAGFLTGLACSLVGTQIEGAFGPLVSFRVALASATAFFVSQMLDVFVFDRLRHASWWRAPAISTLLGSTLDTALFFTIAFSAWLTVLHPATDVAWANELVPLLGTGPALPLWMSLAAADWCVKIVLAIVALLPFRMIVRRMTTSLA
ncbi:queuosine precursor transporter [Falsirhodobacter sp. 1013]|uniref:queuosine precursor transporter n=1 Tax=Falsirhodobacter sp. 1013 TaxID=3417566 RepID=UPI003EBC4D17